MTDKETSCSNLDCLQGLTFAPNVGLCTVCYTVAWYEELQAIVAQEVKS